MADPTGNYYGGGGSSAGGGGYNRQAGSSSVPDSKPNPSSDHGKIFVGGLSWQTTEESLRWHFEQYGPVLSVEVMRDRNTGQPRGFAFVVFTDASTVDLVMNEDKHEINHKIVDVKRAQARGVAPPSIHGGDKPQHSDRNENAGHSSGGGDGGGVKSDPSPESLHNKVFVGGIPRKSNPEFLIFAIALFSR